MDIVPEVFGCPIGGQELRVCVAHRETFWLQKLMVISLRKSRNRSAGDAYPATPSSCHRNRRASLDHLLCGLSIIILLIQLSRWSIYDRLLNGQYLTKDRKMLCQVVHACVYAILRDLELVVDCYLLSLAMGRILRTAVYSSHLCIAPALS